jgi:signal peptidase II
MGPEQATTPTTEGALDAAALPPGSPAAVDPAGPAPAVQPPPEPAPIAPDVPRLGTPFGASRAIPGVDGSGPPSYVFLVVVSVVSLVADVATKLWAEHTLDGYPGIIHVWENHVAFILAKNPGGAWGLLHSTSENVRRPFFLLVSAAAIAFIVTLYRKLQPRQRALKWGLPLVLGGALGNVYDRIRYGHVIDFIDVHLMYKGQDRHWPTFNVADIAICVGVALMAIDMFTSRRPRRVKVEPIYVAPPAPPPPPPSPEVPAAAALLEGAEGAAPAAVPEVSPSVAPEADKSAG